jgi:hypothetical protein
MDIIEVVKLIKNKRRTIFKKLDEDRKSLKSYAFISREFKKGKVLTGGFQKIYKDFYVLTAAGLTQEFFDEYFQLLENKETDLKKILKILSKIPRRKGDYAVELSFASKLIHTVDNNSPIFDKNVANVLGIKLNYKEDLDERIEDRVRAYELLKRKFAVLLKNPEVQEIISDFKEKLCADINNVKMLDFILWKLGEDLEKKS